MHPRFNKKLYVFAEKSLLLRIFLPVVLEELAESLWFQNLEEPPANKFEELPDEEMGLCEVLVEMWLTQKMFLPESATSYHQKCGYRSFLGLAVEGERLRIT